MSGELGKAASNADGDGVSGHKVSAEQIMHRSLAENPHM
jgi:hypothetical protein